MSLFERVLDGVMSLVVQIAPGALGATVTLLRKAGLTWTDRFVQFAVGIIVSWFASRAIGALWTIDPAVLQAIAFTLGMIAFEATPKFATSVSDLATSLPRELADWMFRKKDR